MRCVHLTGSLSRRAGGPFESIRKLAQGLAVSPKLEVRVYGYVDDRWEQDRSAWQPVRAEALPARGPLRFGYCPALAGRLSAGGFDLAHCHGIWTYTSVAALGWLRQSRRTLVVSPRGMLEPWAWNHHRARKALLWALFERRHLRAAHCLHATSEQEREAILTRVPGARVEVIPNGVDLPLAGATAARPAGPRRALFLSRLHPKKGVPLLLRAWSLLRPAGWELAIAGIDEGGHEAELRSLVGELGLGGSVVFLGEQSSATKLETYRSAELFILPTYSENFGIVIAEALAAGVPVITTTGTPWKGLHDHRCGWWVEPEVEAIRSALAEALLLDPAALAAAGARGRSWMEQDFGWPSIASRFERLYSELVAERPAAEQRQRRTEE